MKRGCKYVHQQSNRIQPEADESIKIVSKLSDVRISQKHANFDSCQQYFREMKPLSSTSNPEMDFHSQTIDLKLEFLLDPKSLLTSIMCCKHPRIFHGIQTESWKTMRKPKKV